MNENTIGTQFVSVPLKLIERTDLITAAIYGYIWSKTQLKLSICRVSQATIARDLDITRQTVNRKIKILREAGLISVWGRSSYKENAGKTLEITCDKEALIALDFDGSPESIYLNSLKLIKITCDLESQPSDTKIPVI
jgi:DNA-binding transcriptional ArsR family regulator